MSRVVLVALVICVFGIVGLIEAAPDYGLAPQGPVITGIGPANAVAGDRIWIYGTGLTDAPSGTGGSQFAVYIWRLDGAGAGIITPYTERSHFEDSAITFILPGNIQNGTTYSFNVAIITKTSPGFLYKTGYRTFLPFILYN